MEKKKIKESTKKILTKEKTNINFNFSSIELDRIKLIFITSLALIIFWASFEQAGGLMNIYAFEKTDRFFDIIDFEVPASWFQSINPLLIVILGYSVSAFWVYMKKKKSC